jgi:ABC-type branched-subunit amino acid transport system ATPase component
VLLLDEVAAGLTHGEVDATAQLIRRVRDELGIAVIWIEHAVRVLMNHVERVAVLHQGRKIADGDPRVVAKDPAVIEAYFGEEGEVMRAAA